MTAISTLWKRDYLDEVPEYGIVTVMEFSEDDTKTEIIKYVPERTCRIVGWHTHKSMDEIGNARVDLSCGHGARQLDSFCSKCGARVVS